MKHKHIIIIICAALVLVIAAVVVAVCVKQCGQSAGEETMTYETQPETEPELPFSEMSLGSGIVVTKLFPYTGIFVEDGSDAPVTGVTACIVENNGTDEVQLLVFSLRAADGKNYVFELSTLLPGQKMIVLDSGRSPYDENAVGFTAFVERYAVFGTTPSLEADKVQVICAGSTIRVTNLTDTTMKTCRVYFKYKQNDTYVGGVTFSVKLTDLQPGTPATVTSSHYNEDSCEILFVTYD